MSHSSPASACPDAATLRALLDGTLPDDQQAATQAHVDQCPSCEAALRQMTAGGESWIGMAEKLKGGSDDDPKLAAAMERLKTDDGSGDQSSEPADPQRTLDFLQPADDPKLLGKLGQHEISEVIGWGGMGVVLKAYDPSLHRVVAVKVLASHLAHHAVARRRFIREAQAAAAVCHDNVITIHAIDEATGLGEPGGVSPRTGDNSDNAVRGLTPLGSPIPHSLPKIIMQFVAGGSLQERIDQDGPLELKEILRIAMQTAAGLAAAHAQGVVHRDVKPANILLENGVERVKLTDFGLARVMDDASLTLSGVIAGTPQYMAPEQAWGRDVDARADLFSLGAVMYAMCTGHSPFRARTTMAVLKRVCEEPPRPLRAVNPDVPDWLVAIIEQLLAKNPEDRFQSAAEVSELLSRWLAHVQQPNVAPAPKLIAPVAGRAGRARIALTPSEIKDRTADSLLALSELQRRPEELRHRLKLLTGAIYVVAGLAIPALLFLLAYLPNYPSWTPMEAFRYGGAIFVATVGFLLLMGKVGRWLYVSGSEQASARRGSRGVPASTGDVGDQRSEQAVGTGDPHTARWWQLGLKHVFWPMFVTATLLGILLVSIVRETGIENLGWYLGFCLAHLAVTMALCSAFYTAWNTSRWIEWIGAMLFLPGAGSAFLWAVTNMYGPLAPKFLGGLQAVLAFALWFRLLFVRPRLRGVSGNRMSERLTGWQRLFAIAWFTIVGTPLVFLLMFEMSYWPRPVWTQRGPSELPAARETKISEALKPLLGRWVVVSSEGTVLGSATRTGDPGGSPFGSATPGGLAGGDSASGGFGTGALGAIVTSPPLQWIEFAANHVVIFDGREAKLFVEYSKDTEPKRFTLRHQSDLSPNAATAWRNGFYRLDRDGNGVDDMLIGAPAWRNGIYRLDRDRLVIWWTNSEQPVPTEFAAENHPGVQLLVLRREWHPPADFDPSKTAPPRAVIPFTADEAERLQEAWARSANVPVETTNTLGMKLRLLPPGSFDSPPTNPAGTISVVPNGANFSQPIYLGAHAVTVAQFRKFVDATQYETAAERLPPESGTERLTWRTPGIVQDSDQHPVVRVSWQDAQAFCHWLSDTEQQQYRLPTKTEWAFAARVGLASSIPLKLPHNARLRYFDTTAPVGADTANRFGLHDLFGNVSEWANDYVGGALPHPEAPPGGSSQHPYWLRIALGGGYQRLRKHDEGGGWMLPQYFGENGHLDDVGFRVARVITREVEVLSDVWRPVEALIATPTRVAIRLNADRAKASDPKTPPDDSTKERLAPRPVVAIRGLVPIGSFSIVPNILEFEIERASFASKDFDRDIEPQSEKAWSKVDLANSLKVLEEATLLDPDPIPALLLNPVFSMPLPIRADAPWPKELITHPLLPLTSPKSKYEVQQQLFRFIDFEVNDGKSYAYRVRLKFTPPGKQEKQAVLFTPWSSKSNWATVEESRDEQER